jgi:signal transduction histidine kinase
VINMARKSYADGPAILFVDDDAGNLKVLQIHLSRDFKVLVAQNATEAMEILEYHADEIGLVVSDQRMPGTTGTEFLVKVRQLYPAVERMIITAFADLPPIIEAINNGQISGYISKPWNPTEVRVILYGGVERFCLKRSLQEANLKLLRSEQDSVLGVLAAGIGREINNPAGAVMLSLGMISETLPAIKAALVAASPPGLDALQEDFQQIEESVAESVGAVQVISEITRDLRVLSRLDGQPAPEPTDVNTVIKSSLRFLHKQIKYRGTTQQNLRATLAANVNPSKLTQVLINLCTNAIHAVDEVAAEHPGMISITSWDDPPARVIIEVEDNGHGIPKDIQSRVFDPFFTTKGHKVGLGLGLAISKSIVEQMGGTIAIHSAGGVGTRLVIHLPAGPWPEVRAPSTEKTGASVFPPGRSILIIDDDEWVLAALTRMLRGKLAVHAVADGAAGISALESASYDVILCDMMMPTPDGQDLYEYVRDHKGDHLGRLLFVTGGTFTPRLKKFHEEIEGVVPVLLKPFSPAQVHTAIDKILS